MYIRAFDWQRWLARRIGLLFFIIVIANQSLWADRILAVVGDQVITKSDLDRVVKMWTYQLRGESSGLEYLKEAKELKKRALDKLIEEQLLYLKAKDEGITVDPFLVEKEIDKIKRKFPSEEDFQASLKEAGMTPQDLYDQIEKKLMVKRLVEKEITSKIYVNPVEVTRAFKENRRRFCKVKRVKLDSVFIPLPEGLSRKKEMEFEMEMIDKYMKLKEGKLTWKTLKDQYGEGPVSGWKRPEDLSKDIASRIVGAGKDEIYLMPVKVSSGYIFFRIKERQIDCPKSLSEVQDLVYNYLFRKKFSQRLKEFVSHLREEYYVKVYSGENKAIGQ